jgi:chromosome segregation protein
MKLRRLELAGFKSFADSVELLIDPGVTAVIGPNGCGKSNISDAVRWVLGEHNPRALRGTRMDEIIFQGSTGRRPQNIAEVSLHFDNSDRALDLDFAEVVLGRRVSRSGESEYLINQAPVTRRELLAKLAGTGLGTNQAVVIEARMVDALLSDRPDDRRALFEEAAGLGLYRERKRSTERRLEETTVDLTQLEQLVVEVESRVRSLSRQRRRSERHAELEARRYQLVAALARTDVAAVDTALAIIAERRRALGTEVPEARRRLADREQERQVAVEARAGAEAQRSEVDRRVGEARLALSTLEGDLALAAERRANAAARRERALAERTEAQASAVRVTRERDAAAAERQAAERDRAGVQAELDARLAAEQATRARLAEQRAQLRNLEEALQRQAEEVRRLDGERQALEREMADLRPELSAAETRRATLTSDRDVAATHRSAAEARHDQLAERLVSLGLEADRARHALAEAREHEARLRAERRATEETLAQATARQGALEQLERDRVGLAPAAAALLGARERFGSAVFGPLADFVRVRREDAALAEHVLGEWMHAVVVADLAACDAIHAWHRDAGTGPLLLLPLEPGPAGEGGDDDLTAQVEGGGPAARWVRALLAGAKPFAPAGDAIIRANGAVFLPGPAGAGGPLRRRAELEALGDDTNRLAAALADQERAVGAATGQLEARQREAVEAEAAVELSRGEERHAAAEADDARRQLAHLERDFATERSAVERLSDRLRAVQQRLVEVHAGLSAGELERVRLDGLLAAERARLTELENEHEAARERRVHWQVEEAQVGARLAAALERESRGASAARDFTDRGDTLGHELAALEAELATLETQRTAWQEELIERRAALAELERASLSATEGLAAAERALQEAEERVTDARERVTALGEESHRIELEGSELSGSRRVLDERLTAEWGKGLDQVLAEPADGGGGGGDSATLRAEADEIKAQIDALGPVNPLAVEEHAEEKRRLEHLVTQRDDIVAARNSLQQSVRELDLVARERFTATFASARANFQRVFETLFGGGSCDVFLVDETDPLESEIEIVAKPRGKRTERIHLLSQGERSLVALSLLFGIYLTKPSPFCVLDEVDAPLDDANIGRFTRLLEEFKDHTQFIVITHNPRTMAVADAVYGVTMQEPGVSSVVSVRLGDQTQAA